MTGPGVQASLEVVNISLVPGRDDVLVNVRSIIASFIPSVVVSIFAI